MNFRVISILLSLMFLSACADEASDAGPGGVNAEDAQALDEAAAKLDAQAAEPDTKREN
jgi:hypothetical protein